MTMAFHRHQTNCGRRILAAAFGILCFALSLQTFAQQAGHSLYPQGLPPGVVGQGTLLQPREVRGYFQQVKFFLPEGTKIAFALDNNFLKPEAAPFQAGFLVGNVYRFQVTEIPYNAGAELYPSIEIIDRLYPPAGKELEFPVEIEITQEDLEVAINGRLVTRIIYLEDPSKAQPTTGEERVSLSEELKADEDPLEAAKKSGRPMAILRIGNRQPEPTGTDSTFFFGSPLWLEKKAFEIQAQAEQKIVR